MPKAHPILTGFNGGELSPLMEGRVDVEKYRFGLKVCENYIPTVQGPAERRPGSVYVAGVKNQNNRSALVRFRFSATDCLVLEFGDYYVRFFKNKAPVLLAGVPYEVTSPYALSDLFDSNGVLQLRFVQAGDVVYIAHANKAYAPVKLNRFSDTNWTFTTYFPSTGPFQDTNATKSNTMYSSSATGGVTITASFTAFTSHMVNTLLYLEENPDIVVPPWEPGKSVSVGNERRSSGHIYRAATAGTTSNVTPTHTEGVRSDGAINWRYVHSGHGIVQITGYASPTVVTGTVLSELPSTTVSAPNATYKWAYASWGTAFSGFPTLVTFFRERLVWARGDQIWMTVTGDYENFSRRDAGVVTADSSIYLQVVSDQVDEIKWMTPSGGLVVGTAGNEALIGEITSAEPLGPGNAKSEQQGAFGSRPIPAERIGDSILFVQRSGSKLREIKYSYESDGYVSVDATVFSEHIIDAGVTAMAFQQEPYSVLWMALTDGQLVGFTYNREQNVLAWHRHPIGGGGIVESLTTIPSSDGSRDELWMIVKRTISGVTKRYVEYLSEGLTDSISTAVYSDSAIVLTGLAASATVSGLNHLEGATVQVLVNGYVNPDTVVSGGSITLASTPAANTTAVIGLGCPAKMSPMSLEAGAADGTAQTKTKRISDIAIKFFNTVGCKAGPDENNLDRIEFRTASMPMDEAIPPFTGTKSILWPGGYDIDGTILLVQDQPLPSTIIAIVPRVNTADK